MRANFVASRRSGWKPRTRKITTDTDGFVKMDFEIVEKTYDDAFVKLTDPEAVKERLEDYLNFCVRKDQGEKAFGGEDEKRRVCVITRVAKGRRWIKEAGFSSQLKHARIYTQKHTQTQNINMFATTTSVSCAFIARDSRRAFAVRCFLSVFLFLLFPKRLRISTLKVFSLGTRGMRSDRGGITSIKREGGAHHHSFSRRHEKKSIIISKRRRQREKWVAFCPRAEADKEGEKEQPKRLSKEAEEKAARAALDGRHREQER